MGQKDPIYGTKGILSMGTKGSYLWYIHWRNSHMHYDTHSRGKYSKQRVRRMSILPTDGAGSTVRIRSQLDAGQGKAELPEPKAQACHLMSTMFKFMPVGRWGFQIGYVNHS